MRSNLVLALCLATYCTTTLGEKITARAIIFGNQNFSAVWGRSEVQILGHVDFLQETTHLQDNEVKITGELRGLTPGKHGFHIHALGNTYEGCTASTGHYNPQDLYHGGPDANTRHVGDLGNVEATNAGTVLLDFTDTKIQLKGPHSIIGRAVVLHVGVDDLGKGGHKDSLTTGNAGGRAGCGIVGVTSKDYSAGADAKGYRVFVICVCFIFGMLRHL